MECINMNDSIIKNLYDIWAEINDEQEPSEMLNMVEKLSTEFASQGDNKKANEVYNVMGRYQEYGFISGFKYAMRLIGELRR